MPVTGTGRELVRRVPAGAWQCYQIQGNRALAVRVDGQAERVMDLNAEIARLAKRDKPVPIYRCWPGPSDTLMIPTDAGLWRMGADGQLANVPLGLPDERVMVCLMDYPKTPGKIYVGVAPQQGGQMVELDDKTLQPRLTGGFCGVGPDDSYASKADLSRPLACMYAIQSLYEKRLATEHAQTQPANAVERAAASGAARSVEP